VNRRPRGQPLAIFVIPSRQRGVPRGVQRRSSVARGVLMHLRSRHWALALTSSCIFLISLNARQENPVGDWPCKTQNQKAQKQQKKSAESELGFQFRDWLNNEVPYIISKEEREAFLRLGSNEEREQFIEIFWQKAKSRPRSGRKLLQRRALPPHRLCQRTLLLRRGWMANRPRSHLHSLGSAG